MRKKSSLVFVLICALLVAFIAGCGTKTTETEKNDPEPEASAAAPSPSQQESSPSVPPSPSAPAVQPADVADSDALLDYLSTQLNLPKDALGNWEIAYADITGSGSDEALCISSYDDTWQDNLIIVTGDDGEFKTVSSQIQLGKYMTSVAFENGILAVTTKTGGTGIQSTVVNFYTYSDSAVVNIYENLMLENVVSVPGHPEASEDDAGVMEGSLTDFIYTVTSYDDEHNGIVLEKLHFVYHPETMSFDIADVMDIAAGSVDTGSTEYNLDKLKNGDSIGGFTITDITYDSDMASFTLTGEAQVTGELMEDMMYEGYILHIPDYESFVINIPWSSGTFAYSLSYINISNYNELEAAVGADITSALKNGETVSQSLRIRDIGVSLKDGSEGGAWASIAG